MSTRAKFRVASHTKYEKYDAVRLEVVTYDSEENKQFFKYTPSGHIELGVVNADVLAEFTPGAEFYVDFTKAEPTK